MGEYDEKGSTVMAKELLDVKQLFVNVEDKEILHGVDLKIGYIRAIIFMPVPQFLTARRGQL